jgi:hypothetical protein
MMDDHDAIEAESSDVCILLHSSRACPDATLCSSIDIIMSDSRPSRVLMETRRTRGHRKESVSLAELWY